MGQPNTFLAQALELLENHDELPDLQVRLDLDLRDDSGSRASHFLAVHGSAHGPVLDGGDQGC
jgi:hypothetical protein